MKINVNKLMEWGVRVVALVQGAKATWGDGKSGESKFRAVKEALINPSGDDIIEVLEDVTNKDIINDPVAAALVDESIEIGYTIMKGRERLAVIADLLKNVRTKKTGPEVESVPEAKAAKTVRTNKS